MAPATMERPRAYVLCMTMSGLSIARSLGRRGIPVIGVHDKPREVALLSRYLSAVQILPAIKEAQDAWLDYLLREGRAHAGERPALFTAGDAYTLLVSRHRNALAPYFRFRLPPENVLEHTISKEALYAQACRAGVAAPKTLHVQSMHDVHSLNGALGFPCLVKPVYSHEWGAAGRKGKLALVSSREELVRVAEDVLTSDVRIVLQEYIPGPESGIVTTLAYLDEQSRPLAWCTKQKLRQYPVQFGSASMQISRRIPEIVDPALQLLKTMRYQGFASVEFKRDPRDGVCKLIEINARAIIGSEMFAASGVDFNYIGYCDAVGLPTPKTAFKPGTKWVYFLHDYKAYRHQRRKGVLSWWRWVWSLVRGRTCYAYFTWADPKPALVALRRFFWMWRHRQFE